MTEWFMQDGVVFEMTPYGWAQPMPDIDAAIIDAYDTGENT